MNEESETIFKQNFNYPDFLFPVCNNYETWAHCNFCLMFSQPENCTNKEDMCLFNVTGKIQWPSTFKTALCGMLNGTLQNQI